MRTLFAVPGVIGIALILLGSQAVSAGGCPDCNTPRPETTFVCGCSPTIGQVGIEVAAGNLGDEVQVAVRAFTDAELNTLTIDLLFPSNLLRYEGTTRGGDVEEFQFFSDNLIPSGNGVRISSFGGDAMIPANTLAELAVLTFTIVGEGCDAFEFFALHDDLEDYEHCMGAPPAIVNADFDIKPGHCPNRSKLRAMVLRSVIAGSNDLDVNDIVQSSVRLRVAGQGSPSIAPVNQTVRVTTNDVETGCANCVSTPSDQLEDLVLEFSHSDLRELVKSDPSAADATSLEIVATTTGGTQVTGGDCLRVIRRVEVSIGDRLEPALRQYHVSDAGHVRLSLYDVSGRLLETLVDAPQGAGTYDFDLDSSRHPSGVYFVRFETSQAASSHKVVVVR